MLTTRFPPEILKKSLEKELFSDQKPAKVYTLKNTRGMTTTFMDIGATWVSCQLPLKQEVREVLLGMNSLAEYLSQTAYLGATIGRFANRISQGKFRLNDKEYQITINNNDNALHGGTDGFNQRRWQVNEHSDNHIVFSLHSKDSDQGFPGNIDVEVAYTLTEYNQLCIEYSATCDQACPINLTNHAYFNLDGADANKSILNHQLQLQADYYLPTDAQLIPTGEIKSVHETSLDFKKSKKINDQWLQDTDQKLAKGYDHAFLFDASITDGITPVAQLVSSDQRVRMQIMTDKPAIQFYSGNFLAGTPSRTGEYQDYQGIALETQFLPDSPNQASNWPKENKPYIDKKSFYQYQTTYQFEYE